MCNCSYKLHEVLRILEEADDAEVQCAEVTVLPPTNTGDDTDGDSGDEESSSSGNPNNLNRNQLLADACVKIVKPSGDVTIGLDDPESDDEREDGAPAEKARKKSVGKFSIYKPVWIKSDMKEADAITKFPWNLPPPKSSDQKSPVSLFELFFTPQLMQHICTESIEYASQKGEQNFYLDVPDLKLFLAVLLISGYVSLPRRPMYWEAKEDVHNILVSAAMSRNRFSSIVRNIHFANNNTLDSSDRFAKVRPLLDHVNSSCIANFIPEQTLSVDESMVPYFGRHGAKQYIHGKPIKFGYKMWVLATRLGYVVKFFPYQGAGTTDKELGLGGSVVHQLTQDLPKHDGSSYHIVFDNLFTSPRLLRLLADMGMASTGTLRPNRAEGAPLKSAEVLKKEPRGAYDVALDKKSAVCLVRWNDSKVVTVASTYAGVQPLQKANRYSAAEKKRISVDQPKVVQLYNRGMGGVDRLDQNLSCYMTQHRSKKWYWPMFRFCVDLAVQNAYQLYRLQTKIAGAPEHDLLSFRREIAQVYVKTLSSLHAAVPYPPSRIAADRRVLDEVRTDGAGHWIVQGTQRRCVAPGCKGTSVFACEKCNVGLHPGCFKAFHCK